ncbi:MAG TPA: hypothetical protein VGM96_21645 [Reyranella sp.]
MAASAADRDYAANSADAAAWAADWSSWYGRYSARAAEQSERTVALYQKVADAMSRGRLPPTAMQDALGAFYKARGVRYGERFSSLTTRFFSRIVEVSALYSREMADAVMPGMPSPPALPRLDASEPNAWFRQISEYSHSLSEHISSSYKSFLDRVASGRVDSEEVKDLAGRYLERRFPEYLRQLGMLYFDLLSELNDLRAEVEHDYLSGVIATAERPAAEKAFAVTLSGPLGSVAQATLSIDNVSNEPATIRCQVGELRRADGIDGAFEARISVSPDPLELAPAQVGRLTVTVDLDHPFSPGRLHVGTLRVVGHGEAPLDIPLRVLATDRLPEPNRQSFA